MSEDRLENLLRAVASEVDFPSTPPLAASVRRRIEMGEAGPSRYPLVSRWWVALVAVAALVLVFAGTMTFSTQARDAIADLLGVGGVRIGFGDTPPTVTPNDGPDLGPQVSLAEAERLVGFDVKVPGLKALGAPEIHVTHPPDAGMASLYYPDAYGDAASSGLLVTQFEAGIDDVFFKKLSSEAEVQSVLVGDFSGFWVKGSHFFAYVDPAGEMHEESLRIAENVLLWEEAGITYRVEGGFGKAEALRIARSLEG